MIVDFVADLTALEWALLTILLVAVVLVALGLGLDRERPLSSRPMPLPDFHPTPVPEVRTSEHRPRHADEGETRRLPRGVASAPASFRPRGRVSWLGSKDSQGWWIWDSDIDPG